jgi:hypothetical protein
MDHLFVAGGSGQVYAMTFPRDTLMANFPSDAAFRPDLPVGILRKDAFQPAGKAVLSVPELSSSGLVQTGSNCGQLSSNSDNSNTTGAAFYAACYRYYKPSNGDGSPQYKWRQMFSTGSAHGGNFNHHLTLTANNTQTLSTGILDDWRPNGTTTPSACVDKTISWGISGNGFSATVSDTFTICPDAFGPQGIDQPTGVFKYGWNGSKGCGGGTCSYIGTSGGYQSKVPQNDTWVHQEVMGIAWG